MPAPRTASTPARPSLRPVNPQADLVRRYARMLRSASTAPRGDADALKVARTTPASRLVRE
jgi:hypothetical protein